MTEAPADSQPRPVFLVLGAIVVLALISTLAFFVVVGARVESSSFHHKMRKAQADLRSIETAMQLYKIDNGAYPKFLDDLVERPIGEPRWRGPYLGGKAPVDPWGNAYVYRLRKDGFSLTCYGSDGAPGGDEDQADLSVSLGG